MFLGIVRQVRDKSDARYLRGRRESRKPSRTCGGRRRTLALGGHTPRLCPVRSTASLGGTPTSRSKSFARGRNCSEGAGPEILVLARISRPIVLHRPSLLRYPVAHANWCATPTDCRSPLEWRARSIHHPDRESCTCLRLRRSLPPIGVAVGLQSVVELRGKRRRAPRSPAHRARVFSGSGQDGATAGRAVPRAVRGNARSAGGCRNPGNVAQGVRLRQRSLQ